ncbi:contactin-5-like [Petromyzon marinus]|uniref:contactin-5-like n=1 Tax=Petromyzon marinus TaxID=7757 RepID=UPI003F6E6086
MERTLKMSGPHTAWWIVLTCVSWRHAAGGDSHGDVGPAFLEEPQDVVYSVGSKTDRVSFRCLASGSPPLTHRWYRDGSLVPVDGVKFRAIEGSLEVLGPDPRTDAGRYRCRATNGVGSVVSGEARLKFAYLHAFSRQARGAVAVRGGQGVVMICAPPPHAGEVSYSWLKSTGRRRRTRVRSGTAGKREREGAAAAAAAMEEEAEEEVEEEVEVLSDGRRFVSQLTGNLYITRVEGTDAGRYSCVVRSKARGEHGAGVDRVERSPPTPLLLRPGGERTKPPSPPTRLPPLPLPSPLPSPPSMWWRALKEGTWLVS